MISGAIGNASASSSATTGHMLADCLRRSHPVLGDWGRNCYRTMLKAFSTSMELGMTIYRSERSGIRVCRTALLVSLAAPLIASGDDSFPGAIDDERPISWNELSKTDHHDLRDARLAERHPDWPKGVYAHGTKAGEAKKGGPHGHAPSIASPVPEPKTWAMMLLGLGVVGFLARLRT